MTARRAAGQASGSLHGLYPEPSMGLSPASGAWLHEDWLRPPGTPTGAYGDLLMTLNTVAGTNTAAAQAPSAATEAGIIRITTGTSTSDGAVLGFGGATLPFRSAVPAGTIWATKVRAPTVSTNLTAWSGLVSSITGVPRGADASGFIGVCGDAAGAGVNWRGIVRSGGSETAVDLGVAMGSTWRVLGFEVTTDDEVQFFTLTMSDRLLFSRTDVGDPVSTNIPTGGQLTVAALGVQTQTTSAATAESDWYALGGRIAR